MIPVPTLAGRPLILLHPDPNLVRSDLWGPGNQRLAYRTAQHIQAVSIIINQKKAPSLVAPSLETSLRFIIHGGFGHSNPKSTFTARPP